MNAELFLMVALIASKIGILKNNERKLKKEGNIHCWLSILYLPPSFLQYYLQKVLYVVLDYNAPRDINLVVLETINDNKIGAKIESTCDTAGLFV